MIWILIWIMFALLFVANTLGQPADAALGETCPNILDPPNLQRIINGTLPTVGLETYMVAIFKFGIFERLMCSGTLLSERVVVTAAHCPISAGDFVRIGGKETRDGSIVNITEAIPHPVFSIDIVQYDIQLVILSDPAPPGSKFVRINTVMDTPKNFAFIRVAGYGFESLTGFEPRRLLQVDVPVQPIRDCKTAYLGSPANISRDHHICAGYPQGGCDSCKGDSGGPAFVFDADGNIVQVGIISFGNSCALPGFPGVQSKISTYVSWIKSITDKFQESDEGQNIFAASPSTFPRSSPSSGTGASTSPILPASKRPLPEPLPVINVGDGTPSPSKTPCPVGNDANPAPLPSNALGNETSATPMPPVSAEGSPFAESSSDTPEPSSSPGADGLITLVSQEDADADAQSDTESMACFPAVTSVLLANGMMKVMEDLEIGDRVQVGPSQFSAVIMFTHRHYDCMHHFVRLHSADLKVPLMLSRGHILSINGMMRAAWESKIGDKLELGNGSRTTITRITVSKMRGLFNPQTQDGRIVVNGVIVSTYTTAVDVKVAHALLAPVRYASHFWTTMQVS